MKPYYEDFESIEDVKKEYELTDAELEGVEILYAVYQTGCYDGESLVLFKKEGKIYIVNASHCSCNGLEGCWDPVETNEKALKMEIDAKSRHCHQEFKSFIEFCRDYFGWKND